MSNNSLSVTDQNIKLQMVKCIQWIFKTSGDSQDQYVPYLNGWIQWLEFAIRNPYYNFLTGWVHARLDADVFIDQKRLNDLLKQVCDSEIKRMEKQNGNVQ